jgi:hypothetical protein
MSVITVGHHKRVDAQLYLQSQHGWEFPVTWLRYIDIIMTSATDPPGTSHKLRLVVFQTVFAVTNVVLFANFSWFCCSVPITALFVLY